MYRLPADFDASVFVGKELVQVSFTANTVGLFFDGGIAITVESSFSLQFSEQGIEKHKIPAHQSKVMILIGRVVRLAEGRRDGTLILGFDGGYTLSVHDDSQQYESYRIQLGDKEVIV